MLHHVSNDLESTLWVIEVLVLDTGLDDIERGRNEERSRGTSNRGDEVLEPGGLVIVFKPKEISFGESWSSEELYKMLIISNVNAEVRVTNSKWSRGISGSSPLPSSVETETLISHNPDHTSSSECFWVCLSLDLQDIKREEDDLSNTDYARTWMLANIIAL